MGHPQKPTPITINNTKADGFVNTNMVMKKAKYWDMNLHWIQDKEVHDVSKYTRKRINKPW